MAAASLEAQIHALRRLTGPARRRAEEDFIRAVEPLIIKESRPFLGPDLETDDILAEARAAIWLGLLKWRPGGRAFPHFARQGIRNALQKHLRGSRIVRGAGKFARVALLE